MRKLIAAILALSITLPAQSADDDECAIWLCLPIGFGIPQCKDAREAMVKRTIEFKSPVPTFRSCEVSADQRSNINEYTFKTFPAALMGSYTLPNGDIVAPERRIVPGSCNHRDSGPEEPRGCVATLQGVRLFENGVQMGSTYYRYKSGSDYIEDPETGIITSMDTLLQSVE